MWLPQRSSSELVSRKPRAHAAIEYAQPLHKGTQNDRADWPAVDGRFHREGSSLTPVEQLAQLKSLLLSSAGKSTEKPTRKSMRGCAEPDEVAMASVMEPIAVTRQRSADAAHEMEPARRQRSVRRLDHEQNCQTPPRNPRPQTCHAVAAPRSARSAASDQTAKLVEWCHLERNRGIDCTLNSAGTPVAGSAILRQPTRSFLRTKSFERTLSSAVTPMDGTACPRPPMRTRSFERTLSNACTPVAGSPRTPTKSFPRKSTPATVALDCPTRIEDVCRACAFFFYTLWSLILGMTMTSRRTCESQQPAAVRHELNDAKGELRVCKQELVRAKKRLARAQQRLGNINPSVLKCGV